MYPVGSYVIYGAMGVCVVEDVSVPDFCAPEEPKYYYSLRPVHSAGAILAPVDTPVFMRTVISRSDAEALIDSIPSLPAVPFPGRGLQELKAFYAEALKSKTCLELVELLLSIRAKKTERESRNQKLGVIDESCLKRAEALLFDEIAIALDIPVEEVGGFIRARIGDML